MDKVALQNLITRLERQCGVYMGDGRNPGFTTTEVLGFLRPLLNVVDNIQTVSYSTQIAAKDTDVNQ